MVQTKRPIIQEREYTYNGIFALKETYNFIKNYLEETKGYDVTEKEAEEKISSSKQEIKSKLTADIEINDYFKVTLTFEMKLSGKPVIVEDSKGNSHNLVDGTAQIVINGYLIKDHMNKRPQGPLVEFLDTMYSQYLNKDEFARMAGKVARDVGDLIGRFKQQVNSAIK